jgi:hypothetical protein
MVNASASQLKYWGQSAGDLAAESMVYSFKFSAGTEPPQTDTSGFLINPENGYISGRSSVPCNFTLTVYATDAAKQVDVLQVIRFDFQLSDAEDPINGTVITLPLMPYVYYPMQRVSPPLAPPPTNAPLPLLYGVGCNHHILTPPTPLLDTPHQARTG